MHSILWRSVPTVNECTIIRVHTYVLNLEVYCTYLPAAVYRLKNSIIALLIWEKKRDRPLGFVKFNIGKSAYVISSTLAEKNLQWDILRINQFATKLISILVKNVIGLPDYFDLRSCYTTLYIMKYQSERLRDSTTAEETWISYAVNVRWLSIRVLKKDFPWVNKISESAFKKIRNIRHAIIARS